MGGSGDCLACSTWSSTNCAREAKNWQRSREAKSGSGQTAQQRLFTLAEQGKSARVASAAAQLAGVSCMQVRAWQRADNR